MKKRIVIHGDKCVPFVADKIKVTVNDTGRDISISPIRSLYFDSSEVLPYLYRHGNVEFQFKVATIHQNRIVIDKVGVSHTRPRAINIYILEEDLRSSADCAYAKADLPNITDAQYGVLKADLYAALKLLRNPESDVLFISSLEKYRNQKSKHKNC